MRIDDTLRELEAIAEKLKIRVSYEALGGELGAGGLCKVKGEYRVIIDKRSTAGERATVIAQSLAGFSLDEIFIAPEIRDLILKSAAFKRT